MMEIVFVPIYKGPPIFESPPFPCSSRWLVWGVLKELGRMGLKLHWF